jgi:hypothetical protein
MNDEFELKTFTKHVKDFLLLKFEHPLIFLLTLDILTHNYIFEVSLHLIPEWRRQLVIGHELLDLQCFQPKLCSRRKTYLKSAMIVSFLSSIDPRIPRI